MNAQRRDIYIHTRTALRQAHKGNNSVIKIYILAFIVEMRNGHVAEMLYYVPIYVCKIICV